MRVAVVGAGVAGLAVATSLRMAGHDVVIVEAAPRAGGVIASRHRDGFVLEQGAGSLRGGGLPIYQLLVDLGLATEVIPASDAAKTRFLLHEGHLVPLPSGPAGLFGVPRLGRRGALRLLQEPFRPRPRDGVEVSVHDFLSRRLGARAADALGNPLMAGITGGDPRQIEVDSTFPQWVAWERAHGSLVRGALRERTRPPAGLPSGTFTLRGGLGVLIDAMVAFLGDRVHLGWSAEGLDTRPDGVLLHTSGGPLPADQVVITAPPSCARRLLPRAPATWLDDPPTAHLAAIHLAYRDVPDPGGFGWLAHADSRRDALGCLWVSSTFPSHAPAGHSLFRVMVGGTRAPELAERDDAALIAHARALIAEVQGVHTAPVLTDVQRAHIPQYPVGTARRLRLLGQLHPRVHFAGWWWGAMGVSAAAQRAADLVHRLRAQG